jgi:hypothetical protein
MDPTVQMNNVLLEEIGGRPLRVRPIPVMNRGESAVEQQSGPVELEQVNRAGASAGNTQRGDRRDAKDGWWRSALRAVAVSGGLVIIAVVLIVDRRSARR